jgi:hypothetical protein
MLPYLITIAAVAFLVGLGVGYSLSAWPRMNWHD